MFQFFAKCISTIPKNEKRTTIDEIWFFGCDKLESKFVFSIIPHLTRHRFKKMILPKLFKTSLSCLYLYFASEQKSKNKIFTGFPRQFLRKQCNSIVYAQEYVSVYFYEL